jgi:hypothetical protein
MTGNEIKLSKWLSFDIENQLISDRTLTRR